jgi:hypothetical protein
MHIIKFLCRSITSANGRTSHGFFSQYLYYPLFRNTLEYHCFISRAIYFSHTSNVNMIYRVLWLLMFFLLLFLTVNSVQFSYLISQDKSKHYRNLQLVYTLSNRIRQFSAVEIVLISFTIFICQLIDYSLLFLIWAHK